MNLRRYLNYLSQLFSLFDKSKSYILLIFVSFLGMACLDLVGISLVGPFVLIFFDFERVQNEYGYFVDYDQQTLAIIASTVIVLIFALRSIGVWIINAFILNVAFNRQVELRAGLVRHLLQQDYTQRLEKSTAHYSTAIFAFCQQFVQSLINVFRMSAEILSVIFITGLLIMTDFQLFLIALLFSSSVIIIMIYLFSRRFVEYGADKNAGLLKFANAVNESVFGIKEIKILGLSKFFESKVIDGATRAASAEKKLYLFSIVPRYLVETLLVAIICAIMVFSIFSNSNAVSTISTLSVFLVAALRLLPSISMIITAFNGISLDIDAIGKLHDEINSQKSDDASPNKTHKKVEIQNFNKISFENVSFGYSEEKSVLENVSLDIHRGDFIGLVGDSGEGKTTLIDLILGIHEPLSGDLKIDGNSIYSCLDSWRSKIAYLPQEIFLVSGSITENIALGESEYDINKDKLFEAIELSGLSKLIETLPDGVDTQIGERGLKFSGGQRQRIAMARAFFSNRDIFLLDESTSALDKDSAKRILDQMLAIQKLGATIILISHNEEILGDCNRKFRLSSGKIIEYTL